MSLKTISLWKWGLLLLLSLLLSLIMYSVAEGVCTIVEGPMLWLCALLLAAGMIGLYALFVRWFEKEPAQDIPLKKCASGLGQGFLIGTLLFSFIVAVMFAISLYSVESVNPDWMGIIKAFFLFLIVAVGEEIAFRGVLFRWIDERFGFWWAMGVSGVLFGFLHIFNDGASLWSSIAISLEAGLMLAASYKWSGTLWVPIGIHWAWNFMQGNIYGFAVSGLPAGVSLLQGTADGPAWLTGGVFGAEASIISAVAGLALTLFFIRQYKKAQ